MQRYNFCSLEYALENIHFPKDMHTCELAKNRLVFDELLVLQLGMQLMKAMVAKPLQDGVDKLAEMLSMIPY